MAYKESQSEVFTNTLRDAGFLISFSDDFNILKKEQSYFVRDVEKALFDAPDIQTQFLCGIKTLCKKEEYFRKVLMNSVLKKDGNEENSMQLCVTQESLFRLLLKVECIQTELIDVILEEIKSSYITNEKEEDTSWLRLLLNPLQYLPSILNGDKLCENLLDILEAVNLPSQLEILNAIPEILPDRQHDEVATKLSDLLDDDNLVGAIIDCLNSLNLTTDIRSEVHNTVMHKISEDVPLHIFPIYLQFLLSDYKSHNLVLTLFKVRNALDTIMLISDNSKEKESLKSVIFNHLQTYVVSRKAVTEAWLNVISSVRTHVDHKAIDYLILFMLHSYVEIKKKIVEGIFKKRISLGFFRIATLEKLFEKYIPRQIFKNYFPTFTEIACNLLRNPSIHVEVEDFGSALIQILFKHEFTENIYRSELLNNLIVLTGSSDQKTISKTLKVILSVATETDVLSQHAVLIMQFLEMLDSFDLADIKKVYQILCILICGNYGDESLSSLKNQLCILLRKQLSSSARNVKFRGIVGAVTLVKHLSFVTNEEEESFAPDESINSIENLPCEAAREAAYLLELVTNCTASCCELTGFYYDELASAMSSTKGINKYLLGWLYETFTKEFQNTFVTETFPDNVNDLSLSLQFSLNSKDEMDAEIGINIAGQTSNASLLSSHFRILRMLHYHQHKGDLSSIDALLGCGVILPKLDDEDLNTDQINQVCDCLFYCINWFREVISGFVSQKCPIIKPKILQRLQNLVEVERIFNDYLRLVPEHKLPLSYFNITTQNFKSPAKTTNKGKTGKRKAKTLKTVADHDETVASSINTQKSVANTSKDLPNSNVILFRDIDIDVVTLLKYPLASNENSLNSQTLCLNIDQLAFILSTFVSKLEVLRSSKGNIDTSASIDPINILTDSVFIIPNIESHLKSIRNRIDKLIVECDGDFHAPELYTEEALSIKNCFGLMITVFQLIFSWPGFQHSGNLELLKNILKSSRSEISQTLNSVNKLTVEYATRLSEYTEQCLCLSHGVSIIKTMDALYNTTVTNVDICKKIVKTSEKLLSREWYNIKREIDHGKLCNSNTDTIVNAFLKIADIKTICGLVGTVQNECDQLKLKNDALKKFPAINRQNFHILYLGLCNALLSRVKTEVQTLSSNDHLNLWLTTALTMQGLMTIAKAQESKANQSCFLKKSIGILKIFLSNGIPILETMLKSEPDDVVRIFKTMQTSTRFLHYLCCYSRLIKNTSIIAHVPAFRLTLESLIYRVKAALVANNCSAAFWMGILKNKDIHGEDILSQSTNSTVDSEDVETSEVLPSDSDDDNEIINNLFDGSNSDESEVFN